MDEILPKTYLLVWSPKTWEWNDFDSVYQKFKEHQIVALKWGCGKRKSINIGDEIYFIKLGQIGSQGIMASGTVTKGSYEDAHWNKKAGETTQFVEFTIDHLVHHESESELMIPISELDSLKLGTRQEWHPQQSGISINDEAVAYLNHRWLQKQYNWTAPLCLEPKSQKLV